LEQRAKRVIFKDLSRSFEFEPVAKEKKEVLKLGHYILR
jgi:hypothetical protein